MEESFREKTDSIREVFLYLKRFQGKSFVIKIDHPLTEAPVFPSLIRDLAELRNLGINILIVAGARERIDEVLTRYNIENTMQGAVRISSPDAMPFIKMAAFDVANRIMTVLTANEIRAVIGNWVRARTLGVVGGVDFMNTGKVERILTEQLEELINDGVVPIFPCIGWSSSGEPYNVSSNELASLLARSVNADKLFFVTKRHLECPSRMTVDEVDAFMKGAEGKDHELIDLLTNARETCSRGVKRVHIVDGNLDGVILQEVFSNLGVGTMVYANQYEQIRKVRLEEIPVVLRIMEPWVQAGHLLRRTHSELLGEAESIYVYEVDGSLHGAVRFHPFNARQAEIAGLAVDERYVELGIGRELVQFLMENARANGYRELFVLTTQAFDWFRQLGFRQADILSLPEQKRQSYDPERSSRIMLLTL
ncbi:MAG: amino-acid N-acetyltransferase [Spirochaetales bacterium]|nr:amino-acid N-acetyltransferase [Spirochaetales bacterium]